MTAPRDGDQVFRLVDELPDDDRHPVLLSIDPILWGHGSAHDDWARVAVG